MTISCLVDQFCDYSTYMKNYSPDTIRRYRSNIKLFCKLTGVENIDQVTDAAVHQFFFDGRRNREWSAVTFITYHKSLTVFFRWCVKGRYLVKNPADDVEEPTLEKKLPSKLNQEQALRVLEYIDNYRWESQFLRRRNHAIFAMFIFAGLRRRDRERGRARRRLRRPELPAVRRRETLPGQLRLREREVRRRRLRELPRQGQERG